MLIITGTGRSGTKYIHAVLTMAGLDMGIHEKKIGTNGGVGGYRVLKNFPKKDYQLIGQLRDPLATVISSWNSTNHIDYPEFGIYKFHFKTKESYLLRCWYEMTKWIIDNSVFVYTLPQLNNGEASKELLRLFKIKMPVESFDLILDRCKTRDNLHSRRNHMNDGNLILKVKSSPIYDHCINLYNKYEH